MPYNLTTMQSIFCNNKEITEIRCNGSLVYQKQSGPDYSEPFYVENITNENETVNIYKTNSGAPTLAIEYKKGNTDWTSLGTTDLNTRLTIPLAPGEKAYLRCGTNVWNGNVIQTVSKVGGNIMSLLYGSNFTGQETSFPSAEGNTFSQLFTNNSKLQDASNLLLPATTLTGNCYFRMFRNCTSLTSTPALPATTLSNDCYSYMFAGCSLLTQAPDLPATTLANKCYAQMFSACSSLTSAPSILPATTLARECYSGMFIDCSSLTKAPDLPATTLISGCYYIMFNRCYLLNEIKCLATSGLNEGHTNEWLNSVASTGTFTKAAGAEWASGVNGIPEGWTVVEV